MPKTNLRLTGSLALTPHNAPARAVPLLSFPHEAMASERCFARGHAARKWQTSCEVWPTCSPLASHYPGLFSYGGHGEWCNVPCQGGLFQSDTTCVHRNVHGTSQPGTPGGLEQPRPSTLHAERDSTTAKGVPKPQVLVQGLAKAGSAITQFPRNHLSLTKCCPPTPDHPLPPSPLSLLSSPSAPLRPPSSPIVPTHHSLVPHGLLSLSWAS